MLRRMKAYTQLLTMKLLLIFACVCSSVAYTQSSQQQMRNTSNITAMFLYSIGIDPAPWYPCFDQTRNQGIGQCLKCCEATAGEARQFCNVACTVEHCEDEDRYERGKDCTDRYNQALRVNEEQRADKLEDCSRRYGHNPSLYRICELEAIRLYDENNFFITRDFNNCLTQACGQ